MPVITDHPREKARPWSAKSTRVVFSFFSSSSSSFSSYQFLHAVFSFCPIHSFSYHFPFLPLFPPFFLLFSCCNASDPWFSFWSLSPLLNLLLSYNSLSFKFFSLSSSSYFPWYNTGRVGLFYCCCGFWSNRTLLYFPLSSSVRPSVRHRRDISTFLDILTVYTMKTIYFLNAYHLGW